MAHSSSKLFLLAVAVQVILLPHLAHAITQRPTNIVMGGEWLNSMPRGKEFIPGGSQPVKEVNYKRCKLNVDVVEYLYAEIHRSNLGTGTNTNQAIRDWVATIGKTGRKGKKDQAGHIVGKNQGGLGTVKWNIFPQNGNFNMGAYAQSVERTVNDITKNNGVVNIWFRFVYDDRAYPCRPSEFNYYLVANNVTISNALPNPDP